MQAFNDHFGDAWTLSASTLRNIIKNKLWMRFRKIEKLIQKHIELLMWDFFENRWLCNENCSISDTNWYLLTSFHGLVGIIMCMDGVDQV